MAGCANPSLEGQARLYWGVALVHFRPFPTLVWFNLIKLSNLYSQLSSTTNPGSSGLPNITSRSLRQRGLQTIRSMSCETASLLGGSSVGLVITSVSVVNSAEVDKKETYGRKRVRGASTREGRIRTSHYEKMSIISTGKWNLTQLYSGQSSIKPRASADLGCGQVRRVRNRGKHGDNIPE